MKKKSPKRATLRRQYEGWFAGEVLLTRAMLHLDQQMGLDGTPRGEDAGTDPWSICWTLLRAIRRERKSANR